LAVVGVFVTCGNRSLYIFYAAKRLCCGLSLAMKESGAGAPHSIAGSLSSRV
jgi:hypothetical protein